MPHSAESLESVDDVNRSNEALDWVGNWVEELDELPDPLPGSMLDEERRLNPYEAANDIARQFDGVCRDNLLAVVSASRRARQDKRDALPAFALYPQLRSAIESAAWGYWLLMGGTKTKRLSRALNLTYGHAVSFSDAIRNLNRALENIGDPTIDEWSEERVVARLQEIRADLRLQGSLKEPPTTSDVLREVDRARANPERLSMLNAWKLCSGITHATRPIIYNLSERVTVSGPDERGGVSVELRARLVWIAIMAKLSRELLTDLRDRYNYLATHDYGNRPLS